MPYVMTVDQRRSARGQDLVPDQLRRLQDLIPRPMRGFERTAGDEFQGVLDDPADVVALALDLVRRGQWYVGVGAGPVEAPLPASTRAGRGPAFVLARQAVEAAKRRPQRLAVRAAHAEAAADAEAVLTLLALVVQRRSGPAWEAVDLLRSGATRAEAAAELGVSRQAVGQRLGAGGWEQEEAARPAAAHLLGRCLA